MLYLYVILIPFLIIMAVKSRTILSFVTIKGGVNILFNSLPYLYLYGLLLYYLENEYTFLRSWTTYSYFFVLLPSAFIIICFKAYFHLKSKRIE